MSGEPDEEMDIWLDKSKGFLHRTSLESRVDLDSIVEKRVGEERLAWSFPAKMELSLSDVRDLPQKKPRELRLGLIELESGLP